LTTADLEAQGLAVIGRGRTESLPQYPGTHPSRLVLTAHRATATRYTEEGAAMPNMQRLIRKFETAKDLPRPLQAKRPTDRVRRRLLRLDITGHGRGH
jgi:hypothetical protein